MCASVGVPIPLTRIENVTVVPLTVIAATPLPSGDPEPAGNSAVPVMAVPKVCERASNGATARNVSARAPANILKNLMTWPSGAEPRTAERGPKMIRITESLIPICIPNCELRHDPRGLFNSPDRGV